MIRNRAELIDLWRIGNELFLKGLSEQEIKSRIVALVGEFPLVYRDETVEVQILGIHKGTIEKMRLRGVVGAHMFFVPAITWSNNPEIRLGLFSEIEYELV